MLKSQSKLLTKSKNGAPEFATSNEFAKVTKFVCVLINRASNYSQECQFSDLIAALSAIKISYHHCIQTKLQNLAKNCSLSMPKTRANCVSNTLPSISLYDAIWIPSIQAHLLNGCSDNVFN